ncbi:cobalt-precorrin-6A reductase [Methylorubrum extorquens]|uniref:Precorrin-6x reductase n=1 Tax=Methylorubrum extorquens (strain CM4 / NCIMB 13688) TaxID=440085 RepID=B7L3K0_METC4|nr:precorrin-6x reductase [Methylorubrum extorquens CM4]
MRILILGGTGEASALARGLAGTPGRDVTLSLAGRTASPKPEPVPTRTGGFGGPEGLARHLAREGIGLLVDATHPFAARMSRNAALAAAQAGVPILALRRPGWARQQGDDWTQVASMAEAAAALGPAPRRVFLTIGRQEVAAFAAAPQHDYVVRTIEPIGDALPVPRLTRIRARGPFDAGTEAAFLASAGIAVLVSKNSGGAATYGKVLAARRLSLPVVMVARPDKPAVPQVPDAEAALALILSGELPPRG